APRSANSARAGSSPCGSSAAASRGASCSAAPEPFCPTLAAATARKRKERPVREGKGRCPAGAVPTSSVRLVACEHGTIAGGDEQRLEAPAASGERLSALSRQRPQGLGAEDELHPDVTAAEEALH